MAVPGMNFECFGDIFPYLTDQLVNSENPSVETVIDSLYNYGLIHGDHIQNKVEKSPFYTKQYKKLTPKQQQLLRAERLKKEEPPAESDESDEEPVKATTKKGKGKGSTKDAPAAPILLNSGRTFIGVSYSNIVRRTDDNKLPKGGRGHKAVADPNNPFEAVVNISNRKISLGCFPTVETAAQAHDRALIRANGPTAYKQSGVLNYPLSFYASDSLSKFYAFDTVLRKNLFGADWTGLKPCDFGFLITQMAAVPAKRGADFNAMDGSQRKKRHKGQYSDGDASGSDFESVDLSQASGAYKKKKLMYGNYYVPVGGKEDAETEEPYFKSPGSPEVVKRVANFGSFNKKIPKAIPQDMSQLPRAGDIVVVMHGAKERTQGRPAYERSVVLDKLAHGGWLVFGFPDHSTRNLRGELVTVMGSCETHTKFLKVVPEARTAEDIALYNYFLKKGLVKGLRVPPPASVASHGASSDGNQSSATSTTSDVVPISAPVAPVVPIRRFSERSLHLASLWYQSNSQRAIIQPSEMANYDPESLYNLADYPCLGAAAYRAADAADREAALDPAKRGSRFIGGPPSNRPPNFQTFTSSMFALKLNDLVASTCYLMPQELLLYRVLLGLADKSGYAGPPVKSQGHFSDSGASSSEEPGRGPLSAPIVPSSMAPVPPAPELPVLPWHRSLLQPANLETLTALAITRQQLQEVLIGAMNNGVDILSLIERSPESFAGVGVSNLARPGSGLESKRDVRYTFELSTESRKLITDLGISQAIVNGSTILANTSNLGTSNSLESGFILVGYFSSALEAALVREQVLGLTRTSFGISCSYGGRTGERNLVSDRPNFSSAEWAELKKLGKLLTRFTRKFVLA